MLHKTKTCLFCKQKSKTNLNEIFFVKSKHILIGCSEFQNRQVPWQLHRHQLRQKTQMRPTKIVIGREPLCLKVKKYETNPIGPTWTKLAPIGPQMNPNWTPIDLK